MENATKALLMAATVLVGVMILGIGVYLYNVFGRYGTNIAEQIQQAQIDQFNVQFTKYNSSQIGQQYYNLCTIHDIVTIANLANKNNIYYGYYEENYKGAYYIEVNMTGSGIGSRGKNLEKATTEYLNQLLKDYSLKSDNITVVQFSCTAHINDDTKLVDKVTFTLVD